MRRDEREARIRSFVAVLLPDEVRRRLYEVAAGLRQQGRRSMVWTPVENLHLTLRFLGALPADARGRIEEALGAAVGRCDAFRATLGGLGAFPRPRASRVVWVGVTEGAASLMALQERVETAVTASGMTPEARAYHPHVTLGRVRADARGCTIEQEPSGPWADLGRFPVGAVHLMRSDLGRGPAHYRVLAAFPLRKLGEEETGVDTT